MYDISIKLLKYIHNYAVLSHYFRLSGDEAQAAVDF